MDSISVREIHPGKEKLELAPLAKAEAETWGKMGLALSSRRLFEAAMESYSHPNHYQSFGLFSHDHPLEVVVTQHTPWDTEQLGWPCGRIATTLGYGGLPTHQLTNLYSHAAKLLDVAGVRYVVARVPATNWTRVRALEASGFRLLDGIQTFTLDLTGWNATASPTSTLIRAAGQSDADAVGDLAAKTFHLSRFHNDELIKERSAAQIHRAWAINCCLGKTAQQVYLSEDASGILGFVTIRINAKPLESKINKSAVIDLIAVSPQAAGKGIGRELVKQACLWAKDQKAEILDVQTQTNNFAAQALYLNSGFRFKSQSFTLRWSNVGA